MKNKNLLTKEVMTQRVAFKDPDVRNNFFLDVKNCGLNVRNTGF